MIWLLACTSGDPDDGSTDSGDSGFVYEGCHGTPSDADTHDVYVSFPYADDASQSDAWKRFSFDGALDEGADHVAGRATSGRGAFTPDGAFAFLVDDVGNLHGPAGETSEPYIVNVTIDRRGEVAWLIDGNWPENGGGVYRADIDCDTGALSTPELVWETKNAEALVLRPGTMAQAALTSRGLEGAAGTVHLVDLDDETVLASIDAFGDDNAIVSDAAWDFEGERLLVSDNSEFSGLPTRVAVLSDSAVVEVLDVYDPVSLLTAPFPDSSALAVSGYGDAVHELVRSGDSYALGDEIASPALPGSVVGISRGDHIGTVLVVENTGLWQLEFIEGGGLEDRGRLVGWSDLSGIPGAIALQP